MDHARLLAHLHGLARRPLQVRCARHGLGLLEGHHLLPLSLQQAPQLQLPLRHRLAAGLTLSGSDALELLTSTLVQAARL